VNYPEFISPVAKVATMISAQGLPAYVLPALIDSRIKEYVTIQGNTTE
jgi:hypothetical protein